MESRPNHILAIRHLPPPHKLPEGSVRDDAVEAC